MTIDWNKPLRITQNCSPVTVLAEDNTNRLIQWYTHEENHAFVDRYGRLIATLHGRDIDAGISFIDNVPEYNRHWLVTLEYRDLGTIGPWRPFTIRCENLADATDRADRRRRGVNDTGSRIYDYRHIAVTGPFDDAGNLVTE